MRTCRSPAAQDRLGVYYGFKTMNSHIHMLEALTELSRVDSRPIVKERLREVFQIVRDKIAVEPGALNLYLTRDWRAIPAHDSFGHDIETAYLLVEAADGAGHGRRRADLEDRPQARRSCPRLGLGRRARRVLRQGRVVRRAGLRHDEGLVDPGRGPQRPARHGPEVRRARPTDTPEAFRKQWEFIDKHMIDPVHGGWFAETTRDGTLHGDGAKASPWKANYHTSRAMMNVVNLLTTAGPQAMMS